jgi:hypothetical protein
MLRAFASSFDNDKIRWQAILAGWLVGTLVGAIASLTGASLTTLSIFTLFPALGTFLLSLSPLHRKQRKVCENTRRSFVRVAYASATAAVFVALEKIVSSPTAVHAAALEESSAALAGTGASGFSEAKIQAIQFRVRQTLANYPNPGHVRKVLVSDHARLQAAAICAKVPATTGEKDATLSYNPPASEQNAIMFRDLNKFAFYRVTITTHTLGVRLFELSPLTTANPIFNSCTIVGFTQDLAGVAWVNVIFKNCDLSFTGGTVLLVDCYADECTFRSSGSDRLELNRVLIKAFASRGPITVSSDLPS